jgi:hypothetical protein
MIDYLHEVIGVRKEDRRVIEDCMELFQSREAQRLSDAHRYCHRQRRGQTNRREGGCLLPGVVFSAASMGECGVPLQTNVFSRTDPALNSPYNCYAYNIS